MLVTLIKFPYYKGYIETLKADMIKDKTGIDASFWLNGEDIP